MNTNALRIAIVGCGAVVVENYLPTLLRLGKEKTINVVALVDVDERRTAILRRHFPQARCFSELDAALQVSPSIAIVASPPAMHAQHAINALKHGLHVLCEKPLALNRHECSEMLEAAADVGKRLLVALPRRMHPVINDLREALAAGRCGRNPRFNYFEGSVYNWPIVSPRAADRLVSGGGVFMDKGAHALDFLARIVEPPERIEYFDDAVGNGLEANCRLEWLGSTTPGTVTLSWDQPLANCLKIHGELGEIRWSLARADQYTWRSASGITETITSTSGWPVSLSKNPRVVTPSDPADCTPLMFVEAFGAIRESRPSILDASSTLTSISVIEKGYQSARPLIPEWYSAQERAQAAANHWKQQ